MPAIDLMYVEWRRVLRTGMRHGQEARNALHERTTLFRIYESGIVPGHGHGKVVECLLDGGR